MRPRSPAGATVLFVGGREVALWAADSASSAELPDLRHEHRGAPSALEALEALAHSDAVLAVVDMSVDGLRGVKGWRRIRDAWDRPIIVAHATGDEACAQAALQDGAEDALCLDDPSAAARLGAGVRRALARARTVRPEVDLRTLKERWESLDRASHWFVMDVDGEDRGHRMQQRLAHSERRFRALVEKSSDAIVLLDLQGCSLYASPATSQLLGFAPEELRGRDFKALVHPDDAPSVVEGWSTLYGTPGSHLTSDVRVRHVDGTWRLVQATLTNLLEDPAVGAVVCNGHDVTSQRALEEQVRRAQQWEAIGLLAGGIAHDFNNLLCVIQAAASAAASPAAQRTIDTGALDDINQAAARAAELTRKLLTLSRQQPLATEYLDAGDLVANFASLMLRSLGENIEVVVSCERSLPVRVDRLQIEQVLLNVCTNARHAIQGRGRVRIEGRRCQLPPGGTGGGEDVVEIAIHDDGPGMDEATRRRVFDPFFTTKRDGSGLGLTVSYGIVQRHGGSMWIDSEPGRGTVVTVRLPLHDGPRSERVARTVPPTASIGDVRILVAEDEPSLRRIFCRILRAKGYDVVEAEDGDAAVAKVTADPDRIALVVLDVRLPGMSGPAAYKHMLRRRADLPALFVTGHAPDSEAIPRGSPLLMKPFTSDALLRAIESARGVGAAQAGS
jgi:PAS domain S-box-containing protein